MRTKKFLYLKFCVTLIIFLIIFTNGLKKVNIISIKSSEKHNLVLKENGTLWATDVNSSGQLGTGDYNNRNVFVKVLSGVSAIAAGDYHSLALKKDGTLWATGGNSSGQLGTGSEINIDNLYPLYSGNEWKYSVPAGNLVSIIKIDNEEEINNKKNLLWHRKSFNEYV